MQNFFDIFQIILGLYCMSSLALINSPLRAIAYFIFFRSTLSIAAYTQAPGFGGTPFFILPLLLLLLPTMAALGSSKVRFSLNKVFGTHLLFIVLTTLISFGFVLAGEDLSPNIIETSKYIFPLLAYVLVYSGIKNESDLDKLTKYLVVCSLIPIFTGIIEFALNTGYSYVTFSFTQGERPSGTIIDPNLYGIYLSLCLFLAMPRILGKQKNTSNVLYILLVLFTIIVAKNRGTWVALFFAFMISVPLFRRYLNVRKWVLSAFVLILLATPVLLARFSALNEYDQWGQKQDTASGRLQYSIALLQKAADSPIYGNGANSYDIGNRGAQNQVVPPHDDYVRIACEYGFPAMLLYIFFFLRQLKWTLRHRKDKLWTYQFAACACQIYVIIISVAQNVLTDTTSFMLILSMMAISHRASALSNAGEATVKKQPLIRAIQALSAPRV